MENVLVGVVVGYDGGEGGGEERKRPREEEEEEGRGGQKRGIKEEHQLKTHCVIC